MFSRNHLRRLISWDAKSQRSHVVNGETARAEENKYAAISGRSTGTESGYTSRFTH
jgi:hypothetical protein